MEDAEDDVPLLQVPPGGNGDKEPAAEDPSAPEQEFLYKRPALEPGCSPGVADREGYPDNEQEERGGSIGKVSPEAIRDIERYDPEKREIEDGMKEDHHQHGDSPEEIDLGVSCRAAHEYSYNRCRALICVWKDVLAGLVYPFLYR